jgi:AmiR/NasT family two-component response regulator
MKPIDEIYPPPSTQQEANVNTNQDMTNSEEPLALKTQFDTALSDLGSAIAAVTAMNQAVDLDEATRASAMSAVIDALNKAFDALNLAVSRFRKEARQNLQEDH